MKKSARGFQILELTKNKNGNDDNSNYPQASTSSVGYPYPYNSSNGEDFDSDDSVQDKTYTPLKACPVQQYDSDSDSDIILNSPPIVHSKSPSKNHSISSAAVQNDSNSGSDYIIPNSQNIVIPETPTPEQDHMTKRGTIRKRKIYETSIAERRKARKEEKISKNYALKPGCDETCKRKCTSMIHEGRRKAINERFWSLTWSEQKVFISSHTSRVKPARQKKFPADSNKKNRTQSLSYFLSNEIGEKIQVCKVFFLTTLGYCKTNDKAVRNAVNKQDDVQISDGRGRNPKQLRCNRDLIKAHIESFNPTISHYRREHAPNKRYLSSEISIQFMYNDYLQKHSEEFVSYDVYRKTVKQMNISFAKLGHEECEICEQFEIHNPNAKELRHRNCDTCRTYEKHHERYVLARQAYDIDRQNAKISTASEGYFSVDLQKVIMLPRIDMFKLVLFCPRLVAFNESFVPLGYKTSDIMSFAALWHEGISGRKKEDIICTFRAFLMHFRDLNKITLWLDNCAAQNKNWTLFSFLVNYINSDETSINTIILKYFETGHTFMSADEFHHQVEHALKKKKKVYDFDDFADAVATTNNRKTIVKKMAVTDFYKIADDTSTARIQQSSPRAYLRDMSEILFKKGSLCLFYKTDFTADYIQLEYLKKTVAKKGFTAHVQKTEARGITDERKNNIIQRLGPLMPPNRLLFWQSLATNNAAADLMINQED